VLTSAIPTAQQPLAWSGEPVSVAINRRLSGTSRGRRVQILVDGQPVPAFEGESVAASLLASGRRGLRVTPERNEPRGMYCGIGVCFDCVMTFDGHRAARACMTPVCDGLRVETKQGNGAWSGVAGDQSSQGAA
jgi:hypothetical protein